MGFEWKAGSGEAAEGPKAPPFIRYFLVLGAIGSLLVAYFDHRKGHYLVSAIEAVVGLLGLIFLVYNRRRTINALTLNIIVLLVYIMLSVMAFTQMDSVASLVWVPTYPIVYFFLTRVRTGLFWSALTFVTVILAYIAHPHWRVVPRVSQEVFLQATAAYLFVGALAFFYELVRSRQERQLQQQADYDYLTGIYNRRALTRTMATEISRVTRYASNLSMLLLDLDDFKAVNDQYGHKRGDYVLREVCRVIQHSIRQSDILARWGGEEFAILMPEAGVEQAAALAAKLCAMVSSHRFEEVGRVTVSIGVAQYLRGETEDELLQRVDVALYRAKSGNKNRYEIAAIPGETPASSG